MSALEEFRRYKDVELQRDPYSPIPFEDRESFTGLQYYPENEALRFVLTVEPFEQQDKIVMATSTGHQAPFIRYGQIHFPVNGQQQTLTVYQGVGQSEFFLPFTDATSGKETYGAGRYLELESVGQERYKVDFNLAYNPYCAYSDEWSCPIPPQENKLPIPIEAGEKNYK
jgi:uncharacterized protein (DUF1684 family)